MTVADVPTGSCNEDLNERDLTSSFAATTPDVDTSGAADTQNSSSPNQEFTFPKRPQYGSQGRAIVLRANYFALEMEPVKIQHYNVVIQPEVNRAVSRQIVTSLAASFPQIFEYNKPVFDGRFNLYSRRLIPMATQPLILEVCLPGEDRKFTVFIEWKSEIQAGGLPHQAMSYSAVRATDCIIRQFPASKYYSTGLSFFSPPGPNALGYPTNGITNKLGVGRELWFGYHQSIIQTQNSLMVNMDTTTTAFYQDGSVLDFLGSVLELPLQALSGKSAMSDAQRIRFAKEVKGLKIEVSHLYNGRRQFKVIGVTRRSAQYQTFWMEKENGDREEISVAKYFLHRYNIHLKWAHLPLLQVGKEERHTFLPIELCTIKKGQRNIKKLNDMQTSLMIKASQKNATERATEITKLMEKVQSDPDEYMDDFGISISQKMVEFPGRVLPTPKILFGSNSNYSKGPRGNYQSVLPNNGAWDMRGKRLHGGMEIDTWAMVCFAQPEVLTESDLRGFAGDIQKVSRDCGMPFTRQPVFCKYALGVDQVEPMFKYLRNNYPDIQLIIVILPGKTGVYAEVKKVCDTILGIPNQCVSAKNARIRTPQTLSNICLKINVKVGGVNSVLVPNIRPKIFDEPVIFVGCEVSHPAQAGQPDRRPSISAMVASMDAHPSRYAATVRLQQGRSEILEDMTCMIKELLIKFRRCTGFKPRRIVLYRGGLSEGQFYNALQYELRAIRIACQTLEADYHPAITFLTASKRHHTRLFPANRADYCGRANNVPPGTVADKYISHPDFYDFFLCSHAGIQGTSRPARYHVLWDDSKLTADELQQLTYQLCHTYARCTRSVSIPAPVYYARLVAFRARYHLADNSSMQTESSFVDSAKSSAGSDAGSSTYDAWSKQVKVHADTSKMMYFC